ncbi:MAG TPA: glycosyltransferase family 4 protein [Anaerolineae bacterium]|nr:glycosyltransferase family 4 protein [Anaerolineae bacterium]HIQ06490.1 glycosyltransferase family 4 protein [Anaerolineae bacterium]
MHVVMISKALVVGTYQRKLEELARLPDVRLTAIVPPVWRDRRGVVALERAYTRGYDLRVLPIRFNGNYHLFYYRGLGPLLRRLEPDVVHVDEEPYNLATFQAMRQSCALGVPACFFTWQNLYRRYLPPFSWFERYNYLHAAYAIAGNQGAVNVLRRKGYAGPVVVIPQFGVDPDIFQPRKKFGASNTFVIGYAGGLVVEKGVDLMLQAVAGLPGEWQVRLVGEGPEWARLTLLSQQLGIADRVAFLGRLPSTEMPDFYASLDVLVLPSRSQPNWVEQFGRVLIEAMACGVPVVGSDCGEIPHVIGKAGLVFPEGEVSVLREQLNRLQTAPALRGALAEQGRRRVLTHFTQARIAAQTLAVYQVIGN